MNQMLRKIKTYSKLGLIVAVALVIVLIIFKNYGRRVDVWFFGDFRDVSILWLLLCTAAGSIVSYWVFRTVFSLWKEMRELGLESARRAAEEQQRRLAEELAEQERRIDEKRSELIRKEP